MWPITPKWKSKNPQMRLQGLNKLNPAKPAQNEILDKIAKNDKIFEVRQLAFKILGKENSEEALADIAKNDLEIVEFEKRTEQYHLKQIVMRGDDTRFEAIKKITDQYLLQEIVKNGGDTRLEAIKKITDQFRLQDIVKNLRGFERAEIFSPHLYVEEELAKREHDMKKDVFIAAIKNLDDQFILKEIANDDDENTDVRKAAIEKLTDQNLLTRIAVHNHNKDFRAAAVKNIVDRNIIAEIAMKDKAYEVCEIAVEKITDQSLLADIAKNGVTYEAQFAATLKLTDMTSKINNLINIFKKSDRYNKWEIADTIKALFNNEELSQDNKMKILSLKGSTIREHYDYSEPDTGCSMYRDSKHTDEKVTYF